MPAVSTNIKIDSAVKLQAQELFERLGMNLSTAINVFLRQAIREQAMPFRIGEGFYSPANVAYLRKVTGEIDSGKSILKEHDLLEDTERNCYGMTAPGMSTVNGKLRTGKC